MYFYIHMYDVPVHERCELVVEQGFTLEERSRTWRPLKGEGGERRKLHSRFRAGKRVLIDIGGGDSEDDK